MSYGVAVAVESLGQKIGEQAQEIKDLHDHVGLLQSEVQRLQQENDSLRLMGLADTQDQHTRGD